jgi:plastocyanin
MQGLIRFLAGLFLVSVVSVAGAAEKISILDYCDPADPLWAPTGGCLLKEGDVTFAEFTDLLDSVLSPTVVGHPAWRFEPSFVSIEEPHQTVRVANQGGRGHTFTEVAEFGGGFVPSLRVGLKMAPECASATVIAPGDKVELRGLSPGDHRFQCCIHSWMHALIKVQAD